MTYADMYQKTQVATVKKPVKYDKMLAVSGEANSALHRIWPAECGFAEAISARLRQTKRFMTTETI